jgi:hypothetical protein
VVVSVFLMDKFITISRKGKVSDDVDFSNQETVNLHGTPCSPTSIGSTANQTSTSSMLEELGPNCSKVEKSQSICLPTYLCQCIIKVWS